MFAGEGILSWALPTTSHGAATRLVKKCKRNSIKYTELISIKEIHINHLLWLYSQSPAKMQNLWFLPHLVVLLAMLAAVSCTSVNRKPTWMDEFLLNELRGRDRDIRESKRVGEEALQPPSKPPAFKDPEALRNYIRKVNEYFALIGRPRFG
ncbi:hypothetical protein SprV_0200722100 [Sparganum proliferum]